MGRIGRAAHWLWRLSSRSDRHLWKIKQPYNVSVAASTAALVSLQHSADLEEIGLLLVTERQRLFEQLREIPWLRPYPSQANFILCRVVGKDAAGINK